MGDVDEPIASCHSMFDQLIEALEIDELLKQLRVSGLAQRVDQAEIENS